MLLLALAAGWAAQQEWRWLPPGLFDRQSEGEKAPAEVTTELPAPQQPKVEEPAVEMTGEKPGAAPPGAGTSTEAKPATRSEAAPEQGPAGGSESSATQDASTAGPPDQERPTGAAADQTSPPRADVAAVEPPGNEAPQAEATTPAPEAAGAPSPQARAQEQGRDDAPAEGAGQATAPGSERPSPAEAEVRPSFDVVRVERDGRAVIAGRAAPGAEVELRAGGQVIDTVRASRRGDWVAIPPMPLAAGDQQLTAVATQQGAKPVESEQVVVVAVPQPRSPTAAATAEPGTPAPQPVAVLLPRDGKGTGRLLQAPGRLSAEGTLALMQVSYDEGGKVVLSGEAPPGVPVRIYVDNRPAALVVGDAKGAWQAGLDENLAPGTYTLRLDQLDAEGRPVARIETPFTRVGQPPVEGNLKVDYVVVQPGNSLWRIARRLSGKGLDYHHIFDANQGQIRDPDLIYPGQVFEIPEDYGSAG